MVRVIAPPLLPADATNRTPAAVALQTARWTGSPLVRPQLPSSLPKVPADRFATLTPSALPTVAVHSRPQRTLASEPFAELFSTRTGWIGAPGATPTTPAASFLAPMIPATWVPCPLGSDQPAPPTQLKPEAWTFRSGSGVTPVSSTATAVATEEPEA